MCAGLTLNPTGTITGTPTTPQTCSFKVQAQDILGATATANLSITIQPASGALTINNTSFLPGIVGTLYTAALSASGGVPPYSWSITAGSLPPGLSIVGSAITGTPSTAGYYPFTLTVTDSKTPVPNTASDPFSITVNNPVGTATLKGTIAMKGNLVLKP